MDLPSQNIKFHDAVDLFIFQDLEAANIIISVHAEDRSSGYQNRYYSW